MGVCGTLKDGKHVDGVRQEFKENAQEEEKSADQRARESLNYPQMQLLTCRNGLRVGGSVLSLWPGWLRVFGSVIDTFVS